MNGSPIDGTEVILEAIDDEKEDAQSWIRCTADSKGWFALKNLTSGRFLTTASFNRTIISGNKFCY